MKSIDVHRSEVPEYLRHGEVYNALLRSFRTQHSVRVPTYCLKPDLYIWSDLQFNHAIYSLRFWKVHSVPVEVMHYVMIHAEKAHWWQDLVSAFRAYEEDFVNVLRENGFEASQLVLAFDMRHCADIVQRIHGHMQRNLGRGCWLLAARLNDVSVMISLEHNSVAPQKPYSILETAAAFGSLKCLEHLHNLGWYIHDDVINAAIKAYSLPCVKFLREECGLQYTNETMLIAAKFGYLPIIQYLYETNCSWHDEVCETLALRNKFECLQFAHEKGCPWDVRTCHAAFTRGSWQCLVYAHLHGCDWDATLAHTAGTSTNDDCLEYVRQHPCKVLFATASSVLFAKVITVSIAFSFVCEVYWSVVLCQLCALLMYVIHSYKRKISHRLRVPEFVQKKIKAAAFEVSMVALGLAVNSVVYDLWCSDLSLHYRGWVVLFWDLVKKL